MLLGKFIPASMVFGMTEKENIGTFLVFSKLYLSINQQKNHYTNSCYKNWIVNVRGMVAGKVGVCAASAATGVDKVASVSFFDDDDVRRLYDGRRQ